MSSKKQELGECDVCDETFNKTSRAEILCRSCETSCCKACVRHYIGKSIKDAHCMNCKAHWDHGFLVDNLNKSFVDGEYSETRKAVLFQREQARFPETMEYVERMKKRIIYQEMNSKVTTLRIKYQGLLNIINNVQKENESDSLTEIFDKHFIKLQKYITKIKNLEFSRNILKEELEKQGILKKRSITFIHACPKEGCKGFLSTAWKCGLCENWTCPNCFELKGLKKDDPNNPHECKEENVKSAELIKKSTKNCPKCAVPIYKISGCDQMFCTKCRIAFSWKTGEIDNGVIHNPHYFQVQRELEQALNQEQRQALENNANRNLCGPCGDDNMPNWYLYQGIIRKLRDDKKISTKQYNWAFNVFRQVNHLNHAIMEPMRRTCRSLQDQQDLRARYILSRITKKYFENELVENDAIFKRYISCLQIYDLIITIFRECVNKISEERTSKAIMEAMTHVKKITDYANRELARLSYVYSKSIELFDFNLCQFNNAKFTKTSYLALANSKITHPFIQQPLRRMLVQTKATTIHLRGYNYVTRQYTDPKCPTCEKTLGEPYYTSTWNNSSWTKSSICLKCVFHQPNKTDKLYDILEKEEKELIEYYTVRKNKEKIDYIKTQLKGWKGNKITEVGGGGTK